MPIHRFRINLVVLFATFSLALLGSRVALADTPTPTATSTVTSSPTTISPAKVVTSTVVVTPTATVVQVAPTATKLAPTATLVPPTATKLAPTATLVPPTATKVPPTATLIPPTATKVPPTATTAPARLGPKATRSGPPGNWVTDFTLFNLANSNATVTMTRFDQFTGSNNDAGSLVNLPDGGCGANTICANGSAYYNPVTDSTFPSSFGGSIMVSSSQPLAGTVTIANTSTGTAYASDAYSAVSSPSTSVYLPIIMAGLGTWNTRIVVQNAGTANTNVTIQYVGSGAPGNSYINNLPPNMSAIIDQASLGVSGFNGSAILTSNSQNVAVIVEEYRTTGGVLIAYNGVAQPDAAPTLYMPGFLIRGQWATDFTIVNTDTSSPASVTVSFAGSGNAVYCSIPASGSKYINGFAGVYSGCTGSTPSNYYGAATITSTNGKNLVAVYNIANSAGGAGNQQEGYVAFSPNAAKTSAVVPLVENLYSTGWVTTISVQSVDGTPANLSLTYTPWPGKPAAKCSPCTFNMSAGTSSFTFNPQTDGLNQLPTGFGGGVRIQSTNGKSIVVIADQSNFVATPYLGGDSTAGFVGFGQ